MERETRPSRKSLWLLLWKLLFAPSKHVLLKLFSISEKLAQIEGPGTLMKEEIHIWVAYVNCNHENQGFHCISKKWPFLDTLAFVLPLGLSQRRFNSMASKGWGGVGRRQGVDETDTHSVRETTTPSMVEVLRAKISPLFLRRVELPHGKILINVTMFPLTK